MIDFKTFSKQSHRLDKYEQNHESRKHDRLICAEAAIVYNWPKILDYAVALLSDIIDTQERGKLVFICLALERRECRNILLKHGFQEHELGQRSTGRTSSHFAALLMLQARNHN